MFYGLLNHVLSTEGGGLYKCHAFVKLVIVLLLYHLKWLK